jgi:hypothetical protein
MTVTARIDSRNCGQAQTRAQGNSIVYAVDVQPQACGRAGFPSLVPNLYALDFARLHHRQMAR